MAFWKKKKSNGLDRNPRRHHYTFAHIAFRMVCEKNPLQLFAVIASDKRDEYVEFLWSKVCEECDEHEKTDLTSKDIKVIPMRIGDYPSILVQMPETKAIAEAIFVCIVLTSELNRDKPSEHFDYRYFVLEHGADMQGNKRTVLCEWSNGNHLNMGDGPEPKYEFFIKEIKKIL